jgi:phage baseplate assembly protein W
VFEKIARLFLTRPGTDFEDKNFGSDIFRFIGAFIDDLLIKEVETECYRCMNLYLPQLSSFIDFEVIQKSSNQFNIKIIYRKSNRFIILDSNTFKDS